LISVWKIKEPYSKEKRRLIDGERLQKIKRTKKKNKKVKMKKLKKKNKVMTRYWI
jgi:hypothetical protein